MRFDHIGVVVADLAAGREALRDGCGVFRWTDPFEDPAIDVHVQFGVDPGGVCYELIAPRSERSPVSRALRTGTNITNHVAYLVPDLAQARERLLETGFAAVTEPKPAVAYAGAPIQFFLSPVFSLIELIEAPEHRHRYGTEDPAPAA